MENSTAFTVTERLAPCPHSAKPKIVMVQNENTHSFSHSIDSSHIITSGFRPLSFASDVPICGERTMIVFRTVRLIIIEAMGHDTPLDFEHMGLCIAVRSMAGSTDGGTAC